MRDARVGGTNVGQKWRVTGITAGDTPPAPARVGLEFWLEIPQDNGPNQYHSLVPDTFDPVLARQLGQHLIDMADYAEDMP